MSQRIWLITGISSGIGKSLAQAVIAKGDFVVGTLRNQDQVDQFNRDHSGKGMAVRLDITDHQAIEDTVDKVLEHFGRIDILVNNAGVGFAGAVEETSITEVRAVFEPNFFGTLKMTQAVLPVMRKQGGGHILQISSHSGVKAFAGFGIYNASKFALEGFSEALAQEVEPLGINVTIVEPGPFRTGFASAALGLARKEIDAYADTAGAFRERLKGADGKQEGDPDKAADILINFVKTGAPTLRLPLGKIPLTTIRMKVESVINDLEANRGLAERAVFDIAE